MNKNNTKGISVYDALQIDIRDKKTCQFCGKKLGTDVNFERFVVHHIDGNWKHNNPNNLITLCTQCHGYIHHKRGNPQYIQNKLRKSIKYIARPPLNDFE